LEERGVICVKRPPPMPSAVLWEKRLLATDRWSGTSAAAAKSDDGAVKWGCSAAEDAAEANRS
jgi:hypothetical protein